jgi:S-adenosylhomocysteine hydrolase
MESFDSHVKDMSLAEYGRKEIDIAEIEMPGNYSCLSNHFYRSYGLQN